MKVLILAGGKGTRLKNIAKNIPKPLINIGGKPLLEYQIDLLKKNGLKDITILINHLGHKIKKYFGDGRKWGVKIKYFEENFPLGTAGGIKELQKTLKGDFIVVYGDLLFNIDLKKCVKQHRKNKIDNWCIGTLVVHPNDHPHDSDLVRIDKNNVIKNFLPKPHPKNLVYRNLVNAAVYVLSPAICRYIKKGEQSDFGRDIFPYVLRENKHFLYAYNTPEYLKDIGTSDRFKQAELDIKSGKYFKNFLSIKRPAIFLDRDGVINREAEKICTQKDFKLIKNSAQAIKLINKSDYYAVVVTNQPAIAKGFCSFDDVLEIHKKMETELGRNGAKIDNIYFCPHHPDKGFPGENKKYKIKCDCRKPKTGLIKQAVKDLNIDLKNSYFVGDSPSDALTAKNANIKFIGVKTGYACGGDKFSDRVVVDKKSLKKNLFQAIKYILALKK